ncbi:MAG: hypothetical protein FWE34_07970 [Defluviitaleaceae bacterium]|nr:hypothetical protein [Defluviitaleaceae bacterium]
MKKKISLLKIISVVMIILGTSALVTDLLDISNPEQGLRIISSIAASAICVAAGFFGVLCKSMKTILLMGILLSLITIIDVAVSIGFYGMSLFHLVLFVWPMLYLWGLHISNSKTQNPTA